MWVERFPNGLCRSLAHLQYHVQVGHLVKTSATATVKTESLRFLPSWKHLQLLLIGLVLLVLTAVLVVYISHAQYQQKLDELMIDADRNYELLPFDMLDAERYCRLTLERRFGEDLGPHYTDEHSSRLDTETGLFKMFMVAYIGANRQYEREAVHCFVDPERRVMTHFRTISEKKTSLMSRATKFFE